MNSVRVSVKDDIMIPAKANFVSLKHTTAMIEPIASKVIEGGILMANCLVNPSTADKHLPICLMNVTNEDVVLLKRYQYWPVVEGRINQNIV